MWHGKGVKYLTFPILVFATIFFFCASNLLRSDSSGQLSPTNTQVSEKWAHEGGHSRHEMVVHAGHSFQQLSSNSTRILPQVLWQAERPAGDIIFASCDGNYFREHAVPFVSSANVAKNNVHIHVVNPKDDIKAMMSDITSRKLKISVTLSLEYTDLTSLAENTYFASNRFMIASQLLEEAKRIMIVDIDCLIMAHIEFPENKDLGLFLRDSAPGTTGWVALGTKVAAGMVFVTRDSKDFLVGVQRRIFEHGLVWYVDQVALYEQFIAGGWEENPRFLNFNNGDLDWEFTEGSKIWTGKGERKNSNAVYLDKKKEFAQKFA